MTIQLAAQDTLLTAGERREPLPGGNKSRRLERAQKELSVWSVCFSHMTRAVSAEFSFSGQKIVRAEATFASLSVGVGGNGSVIVRRQVLYLLSLKSADHDSSSPRHTHQGKW